MTNNNYRLIIIFITVFLITNGTFFILCEKDIVLDYINKFGDWTNAILLKSTYIFLAYTLANSAYNIDYVLPKVAHSLFVIKYFDKLNGWLGFSSKGELEAYLEVAKQSYSPLYKDFLKGIYNNIVQPLYTSVWNPLFSSLYKNNNSINLSNQNAIESRDRIKYVLAMSNDAKEELIQKLDIIQALNKEFYNKMITAYTLGAKIFDDVLKKKDQPLYSLEFLAPYFNRNYFYDKLIVHNDNISIDSRGDEHITQYLHQLNPLYPDAFVIKTLQLQNYDLDDINFSNTIDNWYINVTGFATVPQTNFALGYRPMMVYECSFEIPVVEIFYATPISGNFVLFLKERADIQHEVIIKDNNFFLDQYRGDISAAYDQAFQTLKGSVSEIQRETSALSVQLNSVIAATVGLIGISSQYVDSITAINMLSDAITNSEIGSALANVFIKYGQPVPEMLRQYAPLPNPQDYLLPGESLLEPSTSSSLTPNAGTPTPYFNWKTIGVIILAGSAIAGGVYLWKNGYLDSNVAVETAKTLKETLQEKYINFK